MIRKKKKKFVKRKPQVEKEYWEEIELTDPKTGEVVKRKVKIVRYKSGPQIDIPTYKDDFLDRAEVE